MFTVGGGKQGFSEMNFTIFQLRGLSYCWVLIRALMTYPFTLCMI